MLRLNHAIRLTFQDVEQINRMTGFQPIDIHDLDALRRFCERAKSHYAGDSYYARNRRRAIESAIARYCAD
ncbi:hypothetical protein [Massilia sp. TS11]|uniref:hypothetical protein n=1 Tax=Massilia sp. TS11 TaxID=2908003 RepID=UPI001EDC1DC6|nr:hypothetical protein [Massilia sp. TS11]MCG2583868.1 hypothetical protein [Massilia sp. TS11]